MNFSTLKLTAVPKLRYRRRSWKGDAYVKLAESEATWSAVSATVSIFALVENGDVSPWVATPEDRTADDWEEATPLDG